MGNLTCASAETAMLDSIGNIGTKPGEYDLESASALLQSLSLVTNQSEHCEGVV